MIPLFDATQELSKQIDDYTGTYEPDDQMEWNLVLGEIKSFIEVRPWFWFHTSELRYVTFTHL